MPRLLNPENIELRHGAKRRAQGEQRRPHGVRVSARRELIKWRGHEGGAFVGLPAVESWRQTGRPNKLKRTNELREHPTLAA